MPANYPIESVYLRTGLFSSENNTTLYKPAELGMRVADTSGHEWQSVQLDSGATAATGVGAVAAGQVAYWKAGPAGPGAGYIVTNDWRVALGGQSTNSGFRNFVAGVFEPTSGVTYTAGNYIWVQTKGATATNLALLSSATPGVGDTLVSDTTASTAQVTSVNAGTAPTCSILGVATGAKSSNTVPADLNVPYIWT